MSQKNAVPDLQNPMHQAVFWRGMFIHRYSGVEHSVNELLHRTTGTAEYGELGELPYPWGKRLARLTRLLDMDGPLHPYAGQVRDALTPLTSVEQHRHVLVHGMMSLNPNGDQPGLLYFETYDRHEGFLGLKTLWISVDDLIAMTQSMGPFVSDFTRLLARIFREIDLRPMSVEPRKELSAGSRNI